MRRSEQPEDEKQSLHDRLMSNFEMIELMRDQVHPDRLQKFDHWMSAYVQLLTNFMPILMASDEYKGDMPKNGRQLIGLFGLFLIEEITTVMIGVGEIEMNIETKEDK